MTENAGVENAGALKMQQHIVKMFAFHSFPSPAISTPAFSTPALWCRDFHSRVFYPCIMVPCFPLPRFPPLQYGAAFSTPAFSTPANSASPSNYRWNIKTAFSLMRCNISAFYVFFVQKHLKQRLIPSQRQLLLLMRFGSIIT